LVESHGWSIHYVADSTKNKASQGTTTLTKNLGNFLGFVRLSPYGLTDRFIEARVGGPNRNHQDLYFITEEEAQNVGEIVSKIESNRRFQISNEPVRFPKRKL
jgi:hypothetical protein